MVGKYLEVEIGCLEKIYKGGMHVLETFMPGSVNQINRLFKAGALGNEKVPDKYGQTNLQLT